MDGPRPAAVAVAAVVAAGVALSTRAHAAFYIDVWGPLGLVLVGVCLALGLAGYRPTLRVAAAGAAFAALAGWSVLSVTWGGLSAEAWRSANQALVAAAALVAGSLVGRERDLRKAVLAGVLAGLTARAAETLLRLGLGPGPDQWFDGRALEGLAGYHNAEAVLAAAGLPLAVWAARHRSAAARAAGGACAGVLLADLLLAQSRGTIVGLVVAAVVLVALARTLRVAYLVVLCALGAVALGFGLGAVDEAAASGTDAALRQALDGYLLRAALVTAALGLAAAPRVPTAVRPRDVRHAAAVAAVVLVVVVAAEAVRADFGSRVSEWTSGLGDDTALAVAEDPGGTRLASPSLNGRRELWRVAGGLVADDPLTGAGRGRFAAAWVEERPADGLSVLHAHSVEMELLGELGVVGLALFAGAVALALAALRQAPSRRDGGAAVALLVLLVVQASFDWTWSFPGVVAPGLLAVGAACGGAPPVRLRGGAAAVVVAVGLGVLATLALPYLANDALLRASRATTPDRAADLARRSLAFNPWNAAAVSYQGQLAESSGRYREAATLYTHAATLTQRPWLEHYRAARALAAAGDARASRSACAAALGSNPTSRLLDERCAALSASGGPAQTGRERRADDAAA